MGKIKRTKPGSSRKSLVSVVVTTKNESSVLGRLLDSIQGQTYSSLEIIVVDNDSTDNTKDMAREYTKFVFNKGPERSAQRNFGARKGQGKYFLFLDADMELSRNVIKECVDLIEKNPNIGAVIIPEESISMNYWEKVKAFERSFYVERGYNLVEAARFFTKEAFKKSGGYDESITGPEDWDLTETIKNLGYEIGRIKSKIYHYERVASLLSLIKKKYYYGLKSHRYLRKQKISVVSPKTIYFLRPVFYKNWKKLLANPTLSCGMFLMVSFELIGGGLGFLVGRVKNL